MYNNTILLATNTQKEQLKKTAIKQGYKVISLSLTKKIINQHGKKKLIKLIANLPDYKALIFSSSWASAYFLKHLQACSQSTINKELSKSNPHSNPVAFQGTIFCSGPQVAANFQKIAINDNHKLLQNAKVIVANPPYNAKTLLDKILQTHPLLNSNREVNKLALITVSKPEPHNLWLQEKLSLLHNTQLEIIGLYQNSPNLTSANKLKIYLQQYHPAWIILASPSAANALFNFVLTKNQNILAHSKIATIGKTTASKVKQLGGKVNLIAPKPDLKLLLNLIINSESKKI